MIPIIIPVYQPQPVLLEVVTGLLALGCQPLVVINDGSTAGVEQVLARLPAEVILLNHRVNCGKGAALRSGLRFVRDSWPDAASLVTADGDGQHLPEDIARVVREAVDFPGTMILGTRSFSRPGVPWRSRVGNWLVRLVIARCSGRSLPDTQTGLRGLPSNTWNDLLRLRTSRYEFETEVLMECRHLPVRLVPIETLYLEGNSASHYRPLRDSLRILSTVLRWTLLRRLLRAPLPSEMAPPQFALGEAEDRLRRQPVR